MSVKAVLFDLDGTLLPMDQDAFINGYFKLLTKKAASHNYEPKKLAETIWQGTAAMVHNDGMNSNEMVFWKTFTEVYGENAIADKWIFEEFYRVEFQDAIAFCGSNPAAVNAVQAAKELGFRIALATNPVFPSIATESRIRWAGLKPQDFDFFTAYEDIGFCKPNTKYYLEVANRLGLPPEECLVVGNDVTEDMVAESIGMKVFLLTDCLINKADKDISDYPNGDFDQLIEYLNCMTAGE